MKERLNELVKEAKELYGEIKPVRNENEPDVTKKMGFKNSKV